MCSPSGATRTDAEIIVFLESKGYDPSIDAATARGMAAEWLRCFPRSGPAPGVKPKGFEDEGYAFRPGQKQELADFVFPPPI